MQALCPGSFGNTSPILSPNRSIGIRARRSPEQGWNGALHPYLTGGDLATTLWVAALSLARQSRGYIQAVDEKGLA